MAASNSTRRQRPRGKKEQWEQSMDLGTVTMQPSLGVRKLQAVVTNRVGVAP